MSLKSAQVTWQPLLKWPGGKRSLVNAILPFIPQRFNTYYEPFLGGGALFFALKPERAVLADKNDELMQVYSQIRNHPERVIEKLRRLRNSEQDYYKIRSSRPRSDAGRAARFIYLITLAFNGIYRVNLNGTFNVPYGYKTHLNPCDDKRIHATSKLLKRARLLGKDFEKVLVSAEPGDLVYLDPPYTVAHANNGFVKYNAKIFSWDDQIRLARVATRLAKLGCTVIVSNANHSSIRDLYKGFNTEIIERNSVIAASSNFRSVVTECLFYAIGRP